MSKGLRVRELQFGTDGAGDIGAATPPRETPLMPREEMADETEEADVVLGKDDEVFVIHNDQIIVLNKEKNEFRDFSFDPARKTLFENYEQKICEDEVAKKMRKELTDWRGLRKTTRQIKGIEELKKSVGEWSNILKDHVFDWLREGWVEERKKKITEVQEREMSFVRELKEKEVIDASGAINAKFKDEKNVELQKRILRELIELLDLKRAVVVARMELIIASRCAGMELTQIKNALKITDDDARPFATPKEELRNREKDKADAMSDLTKTVRDVSLLLEEFLPRKKVDVPSGAASIDDVKVIVGGDGRGGGMGGGGLS